MLQIEKKVHLYQTSDGQVDYWWVIFLSKSSGITTELSNWISEKLVEKFFLLFFYWTCDFPLSIFYVLTFAGNFLRYAYSEELGEEFDEEEAQSLTREKPDGDISLVEKKEKSVGGTRVLDEDGEAEEDKREWSAERFPF